MLVKHTLRYEINLIVEVIQTNKISKQVNTEIQLKCLPSKVKYRGDSIYQRRGGILKSVALGILYVLILNKYKDSHILK